MQITLLCNAGLAITYNQMTLLVDVFNGKIGPFFELKEEMWQKILNHEHPFENIVGLYFTHDHPDHFDADKVKRYTDRWPETPVFIPKNETETGKLLLDCFEIEYQRIDHAPMDVPVPPHVVTWIKAGEKSVYLAADAKLDADEHRAFLDGKRTDVAFWNAMYLSREQTRCLLRDVAEFNYIYHMPEKNPDEFGIWKKCEKNFLRYGSELEKVAVLDKYPAALMV